MGKISFLNQIVCGSEIDVKEAVRKLPLLIQYKSRIYRVNLAVVTNYVEEYVDYPRVFRLTYIDQSSRLLEVDDNLTKVLDIIDLDNEIDDDGVFTYKEMEKYNELVTYMKSSSEYKSSENEPILGPMYFQANQLDYVCEYLKKAFEYLGIHILTE